MSQQESGAAEQMVGWSIKALEAAARLSASGAKNLAVFIAAHVKSNPQNRGKTTLGRMLRDGKELKVFQIEGERLKVFAREAKRHGVLFTAIRDRKMPKDQIDLMVRADDASKINRIIEKMGLASCENPTTARNGRRKPLHGSPRPSVHSSKRNATIGDSNEQIRDSRPSVREEIKRINASRTSKKRNIPQKAKGR